MHISITLIITLTSFYIFLRLPPNSQVLGKSAHPRLIRAVQTLSLSVRGYLLSRYRRNRNKNKNKNNGAEADCSNPKSDPLLTSTGNSDNSGNSDKGGVSAVSASATGEFIPGISVSTGVSESTASESTASASTASGFIPGIYNSFATTAELLTLHTHTHSKSKGKSKSLDEFQRESQELLDAASKAAEKYKK